MTKEWNVDLSSSTFINNKFGWITLEGLGDYKEFHTEEESVAVFYELLEKGFDTNILKEKIQDRLEACREQVLKYDSLYK